MIFYFHSYAAFYASIERKGDAFFPLFYYDTSSSPKEMQSCSAYSAVVAWVINPAIRVKSPLKGVDCHTRALS